MAEKKFSNREAIKFGWQTMKQNFWFFVGLLATVFALNLAFSIVSFLFEKTVPLISWIVDLSGVFVGFIIGLGLLKISLNFCDNLKSKIADLFSQYRLFFKFLFASILYSLIVLGGLLLLIIPGIYLAIRLQFYRYFIVDKGSGITESLKKSWEITRGSAWNLFLFGLLLGLINLAGTLFFLIGLFATIPTTMVATAFVYRQLLNQIEGTPAQPQPLTTIPA
jgi:hypothetical protein